MNHKNQEKKESTNPFLYSIPHRLSYYYVLKYLNLTSQDSLLDIGCGLGQFLELAQKYTKKLTGIDNDPAALSFAQRTTNANLIQANADQLPFPDSSFDKIVIILVLEHIKADKKAIQEIKRVAKNNATLVIEVPCTQGKFMKTKLRHLMHTSGTEKHFRDGYTFNELKNLLEQEGFKIEKKQFSCVYFTELFIQFTKYYYSRKNKKYDSQADILTSTENSKLFKIYKFFFPFMLAFAKLEDKLLSPFLKGHALIMKAKINK